MNIDGTGTYADWIGVVLSFVAIVLGLAVAYLVFHQTKELHRENHRRDLESYGRERYQALVDLTVEILDGVRHVLWLTNPRLDELLAAGGSDDPGGLEARHEALATLASLETRLETVVLTERLLPDTGDALGEELTRLRVEAAWLMGDATAAVLTHFDPSEHETVVWTPHERIDAVVDLSFQNSQWGLLGALHGFASTSVPTFREEGSPLPAIYRARVAELRRRHRGDDTARESDLVRASFEQLVQSADHFREAAFAVINAHDQHVRKLA